jgi:hypothetical protein
MNITLRKAAALQNAINETIKGINLHTDVAINEFQNSEHEVSRGAEAVAKNINRVEQLTNVLFEVRNAVGDANSNARISQKLTELARLEKLIQLYAGLSNRAERVAPTVLQGQIDKIRTRPADSRASIYGMADTVSTSVFTAADIAEFRKKLSNAKKAKQVLQDQVLELNVRATINLTEHAVTLLESEGIL